MDVLFMNSSVYEIPSSRRVGAIVYDGAADMRLWRGPGGDRQLTEAWGGNLQAALDTERNNLGRDSLALGEVMRVHKGRLHCDFLLWVATRPPDERAARAPTPDLEGVVHAVSSALSFVAERGVARVAFPALGDGPNAVDGAERLAAIVRAADAYAERCFAEGRSAVIEEVIVCEASVKTLGAAKRMVSGLAKAADDGKPARAPFRKAPAKRRVFGGASSSSSSSTSRSRKKAPPKPTLSPDEIGSARAGASAYDMSRTYAAGDSFIHPKFGVGRVYKVTQENAIEVVFEDRSLRKMVHGRG